MKKFLIASAALLSVTSAYAADLPRKSTPVMPVAMPTAAPMWQGFYLGAQGGWFQGTAKESYVDVPGSTSYRGNGAKIGAFAGYNWQFGNVVAGVEADAGYAFNKSSKTEISAPFTETYKYENQLDGSVRLRAGYLITPSILLYATGGYAFGGLKYNYTLTGGGANTSYSESKTLGGYTLGGGIEAMIARNWIARVEYRYTDFGSANYGDTSFGTWKVKDKTNQVNLGLGYKF